MNGPSDDLVYMACVALGFSLIENYLCAHHTLYTSWLIALRLIICTPMHIAFSIWASHSSGYFATVPAGAPWHGPI